MLGIIIGLVLLGVGGFVLYVSFTSAVARKKNNVQVTTSILKNTKASVTIGLAFVFVGTVMMLVTVNNWMHPKPKSILEQYQAR